MYHSMIDNGQYLEPQDFSQMLKVRLKCSRIFSNRKEKEHLYSKEKLKKEKQKTS